MSASTSRRSFFQDAARCTASCGSEARLFYHAASSGDAATMIDLSGRAYSRMPTAFRYRKALVPGCACKPEPWAQSEIQRHRRYAAIEAMEKSQALAKSQGLGKSGDAPAAVADAGPDDRSAPPAKIGSAVTVTPVGDDDAATTEDQRVKPLQKAAAAPAVRPTRAKLAGPKQPAAKSVVAGAPRKTDPQPRAALAAVPPKAVPKAPPPGLFGLGAPKQRWPGD